MFTHGEPGTDVTDGIFVGNTCIDDNTTEQVKIAIFNAIGEASQGVEVTVVGDAACLEGRVDTEQERAAAQTAARSIDCIAVVDNRLVVEPIDRPSTPQSDT